MRGTRCAMRDTGYTIRGREATGSAPARVVTPDIPSRAAIKRAGHRAAEQGSGRQRPIGKRQGQRLHAGFVDERAVPELEVQEAPDPIAAIDRAGGVPS